MENQIQKPIAMSTTISENSKELFLSIALKEFHSNPHEWQYRERDAVIRMLIDYGEKEKAKELTVLL